DAPWGLALAPQSFGKLAGDLLVGNFGNGKINVYNPVSGSYLDTLKDPDGEPIQIGGLWALRPGHGFAGAGPDLVYFTARLDHEQHGLFGSLKAVPPGSPEGPAEAQAVLAAQGVVQIDLARLIQDSNRGAGQPTIAQDMRTLDADFVALARAEQRFAEDGLG